MVDYLNHVGYNGLMLSVLADGSTIYPSRLLEPTPLYDTGVFFGTGQDPLRKDVLELLLRVFDREQLALVPLVQFSSPLPELEEILRRGGPGQRGPGVDRPGWRHVAAAKPAQPGQGARTTTRCTRACRRRCWRVARADRTATASIRR